MAVRLAEKKFLVVEDYPPNQEVMADILELLNAKADFVEDGETAIEKIGQNNYDLVFLDLQIPVLSGFDVAKEVRKKDDKTILVALTANALVTSKQQCLNVGMNDYLSKPITFDDVKNMIFKHLS